MLQGGSAVFLGNKGRDDVHEGSGVASEVAAKLNNFGSELPNWQWQEAKFVGSPAIKGARTVGGASGLIKEFLTC